MTPPPPELVPGAWDSPLDPDTAPWWGLALLQQLGLVPRPHASRVYVTDLNSTHGTTVNGYVC